MVELSFKSLAKRLLCDNTPVHSSGSRCQWLLPYILAGVADIDAASPEEDAEETIDGAVRTQPSLVPKITTKKNASVTNQISLLLNCLSLSLR
jgi:hypothetical protein